MQLGVLQMKSNRRCARAMRMPATHQQQCACLQLTSLDKLENLLDKLVLCQRVRNWRKDDYEFLLRIVLHGHVNILLAHFGGPK